MDNTPRRPAFSPGMRKMLEHRQYQIRPDAPPVHAHPWGDVDRNIYGLTFNGVNILTLRVPAGIAPRLRAVSDGDYQSTPMIQQYELWTGEDAEVEAELFAPVEIWNMRPRRANGGEAILGQLGAPLMYGVNGAYLHDWDFLISWHGLPFRWESRTVERDEGGYRARFKVKLGKKPWLVLLRPHYYREHLGYSSHAPWRRRPNPKAVAGWCSWEAYRADVTQEHVEEASKALAPLRRYGLEYLQLDDGYQQTDVPMREGGSVPESWLTLNEKFPGGHPAIISAISGGGFTPGIWTNATLTNQAASKAADCCLKTPDGELLYGAWIQYILDCTPETLAEQVAPYYREFRQLGYRYVKSDSLRHLLFDGLQEAVRLGLMEPQDAQARQRAYMEAAREALGDDVYYLSCWGVLGPSIGVCDAMRVGTDASPSWCSVSMQLRETARWFFAQRVMFTVDPDHVCVRAEYRWVRMLLSLVSLTGGLYMISDRPESYDESRLELIRRTLPALSTHAAETGPVDYTTPANSISTRDLPADEASRLCSHIDDSSAPFSSLWATHFSKNGRVWTVFQRCAVIPMDPLELSLEALALDPGRTYYAFDFWAQRGEIVDGGALSLPGLELGDTTVLALTEIEEGRSALVGSSRHVSMDAVSVLSFGEEAPGVWALRVQGFEGLACTYAIYAPGGARLVTNDGCRAEIRGESDLTLVDVTFAGEDAVVMLSFS